MRLRVLGFALILAVLALGIALAAWASQTDHCPAGGTYAGHGVCLGPPYTWSRQ